MFGISVGITKQSLEDPFILQAVLQDFHREGTMWNKYVPMPQLQFIVRAKHEKINSLNKHSLMLTP